MKFSTGLKKIARRKVAPSKLKEALALGGGIALGIKLLPKQEES